MPLTSEPWGAYYCTFTPPSPRATVSFAGTKAEGILPPTGSHEWWGGTGDYADNTLTRTVTGVQDGDTLNFETWFDIDQDYDFGYVEPRATARPGPSFRSSARCRPAPGTGTSRTPPATSPVA